jgi:hypothetical protein
MKNLIKLLFLTVILFGVSCNQSDNENDLLTVKSPAEGVGALHNDGLDFIFAKLSESNTLRSSASTVSSVELATLARDYVQTVPGYTATITLADIDYLASHLDNIRANFTSAGIQQYWSSIVNDDSFKNLNLSSLELKAVGEVEQVFKNVLTSNFSAKQQYDYIKANAAKIQSTYVQNLLANNQGELLSGLLQIMSSSNDYWYSSSITTNTPLDPLIPYEPLIVQCDAIGYIVGWAVSWKNDNRRFKTQEEFDTNVIGRIEDGLWGAIGTSTIRGVVKWF